MVSRKRFFFYLPKRSDQRVIPATISCRLAFENGIMRFISKILRDPIDHARACMPPVIS